MSKAKKILENNMKKNLKNIQIGAARYEKIYRLTDNYIRKNKERYDQACKNVNNRFIDSRELASVIMPYYFDCLEYKDNKIQFNTKKYEECLDTFMDKIAFVPKGDPEFEEKHKDDKEIDELGLNKYERYYYDQIRPYFDRIYSQIPVFMELDKKFICKKSKISVLDAFNLMYTYHFAQGMDLNISNVYNKEYYDQTFSNYEKIKMYKTYTTINTHKSFALATELARYKIYDSNNVNMVDFKFSSDALYEYINNLKDPSKIEIEFNPSFYEILASDEIDNDDMTLIRDVLDKQFDLYNLSDCQNFKDVNRSINNIFVDGKPLSNGSKNKKECYLDLARKIMEGNHKIEIVDLVEANGKVIPNIVPVKIKHNQKAYNKENHTKLDRLLNFLHLKSNIRRIEKIEDRNFLDTVRTSDTRSEEIYNVIRERVAEFNSKEENKGKMLGFECPIKSLNFDVKEQKNNIIVNDVKNVNDIKNDEINIEPQKEIINEKSK